MSTSVSRQIFVSARKKLKFIISSTKILCIIIVDNKFRLHDREQLHPKCTTHAHSKIWWFNQRNTNTELKWYCWVNTTQNNWQLRMEFLWHIQANISKEIRQDPSDCFSGAISSKPQTKVQFPLLINHFILKCVLIVVQLTSSKDDTLLSWWYSQFQLLNPIRLKTRVTVTWIRSLNSPMVVLEDTSKVCVLPSKSLRNTCPFS